MDIKMEFKPILTICYGCLCDERNVKQISGELNGLFLKLLNDDGVHLQGKQVQLCWECTAFLKKLKLFQAKINTAQLLFLNYLQSYCDKNRKESIETVCLSSLKIIHNDTFNKIYYEDANNIKEQDSNVKCSVVKHNLIESNDVGKNEQENKEPLLEVELDIGVKEELSDNIEDYNSNNGNNSDYYETDIKIENDCSLNESLLRMKRNICKGVNKRRKYATFAVITRNSEITKKKYMQYAEKVNLNQKDFEDITKRDKKRRGYARLQYKCNECKDAYLKKTDLIRHVSFSHNNKIFPQKCAACQETISLIENLEQHWIDNHNAMWKCQLCSETCRTVADIKKHIRDTHSKLYGCKQCDKIIGTFSDFVKHYKFHEMCFCDLCGERFLKKETLIRHIKFKHTPAFCKLCNRPFLNNKTLKYHNLMSHPELASVETRKELSYCVECDIQYPSVLKYRLHLQSSAKHNKPKKIRVPCPECGKIFTRTNFMRNHFRFAHLKKTKHYCEKCDKYYTTGYGLRQHIARVHNKIVAPKTKVCDLCGRAFGTNKILTNHRRTHTGERPYKCVYCPAAFAQQTAMKTHQKTQHKNETLNISLNIFN